jgi:predicted ATPase
MIQSLSIKNFKSIKDSTINLRAATLLMGLNGSGKSSIIQVLLLLMQSDKLGEGALSLKGILAEIGQGRDALYQFAQEDFIRFELTTATQVFTWTFNYVADTDRLEAAERPSDRELDAFRSHFELFQYISADRIGPQTIYQASTTVVSDKRQLGIYGEYAVHYLNTHGANYEVPASIQHPSTTSTSLRLQVNAWLKEISPGVALNTRYLADVDQVILDYQFDYGNQKTNPFRPKNVGFGLSYLLPIVIALLTAEAGKTVVIENPESHIHPRGQAAIGRLIALSASTGAQLLIETHSDHILNGIRVAVKEQVIHKNNVQLLYLDKHTTNTETHTQVHEIQLDENGTLSNEPEGLLDEWSNQLLKLF